MFGCRVVGRKFTGVGKPHDKSADDDRKPVNDSIVFRLQSTSIGFQRGPGGWMPCLQTIKMTVLNV